MFSYFEADEIGKAMYRKKLSKQIEDLYFHLISIDEFEGTLVDFVEQTKRDMIQVENYEGVAALEEISKKKGWL